MGDWFSIDMIINKKMKTLISLLKILFINLSLHNCVKEINLRIIGLMVIPPNDDNAEKYFKSLNALNKSLALKDMSMGMSADYLEAIKFGSTFIRVGSSIFGSRS